MAIYKYEKNNFSKIETTSFNIEGILERKNIQTGIKNNFEIIAPGCLVIAEEFSEWADSKRRIDLLAIDKQANLVVIEIKRSETGEHMELQALRYAAMISTLTYKKVIEIYQKYLSDEGINADAENKLLEFLEWDEAHEEDFASDIRIILVSSDFSKELTTAVMWLNERNLDIQCVRIIPYKYENSILIDIQRVIPLPEVESYQVKLKEKSEERRQAIQTSKDFTKYKFNGFVYNKRKLVQAVVNKWIEINNPSSLSEIEENFPVSIKNRSMFSTVDEAKDIYARQNILRHFLNEEELISLDNVRYALSNQWGKGPIERFIENAKKLGFEIEELK